MKTTYGDNKPDAESERQNNSQKKSHQGDNLTASLSDNPHTQNGLDMDSTNILLVTPTPKQSGPQRKDNIAKRRKK